MDKYDYGYDDSYTNDTYLQFIILLIIASLNTIELTDTPVHGRC